MEMTKQQSLVCCNNLMLIETEDILTETCRLCVLNNLLLSDVL